MVQGNLWAVFISVNKLWFLHSLTLYSRKNRNLVLAWRQLHQIKPQQGCSCCRDLSQSPLFQSPYHNPSAHWRMSKQTSQMPVLFNLVWARAPCSQIRFRLTGQAKTTSSHAFYPRGLEASAMLLPTTHRGIRPIAPTLHRPEQSVAVTGRTLGDWFAALLAVPLWLSAQGREGFRFTAVTDRHCLPSHTVS